MLEQQNERLVEKVSFCEIYNNSNLSDIKSFSPNYEFKVIDCKGNVSEQTVSVTVTLKHSLPHQSVKLFIGSQKPIAYGETGNSFEYKEAEFPQSSGIMGYQSFNMPTDILIKGTLVFRNVLSQTQKFTMVKGKLRYQNEDGGGNKGEGEFEIKNLNINWN